MSEIRRPLLVLLFGLIFVLLQGMFRHLVGEGVPVPNLVLLLVVFLALHEGSLAGAVLAFLLGLELDLASGVLVGPWAGACVASFGVLASVSQRIFIDSRFVAVLAAFACSIISSVLYLFVVFEFKPAVFTLAPFSLLEAMLNAALAPLCFGLFRVVLVRRERIGAAGRLRSVHV